MHQRYPLSSFLFSLFHFLLFNLNSSTTLSLFFCFFLVNIDINVAFKFADELLAGTVWVNAYHVISAQGISSPLTSSIL